MVALVAEVIKVACKGTYKGKPCPRVIAHKDPSHKEKTVHIQCRLCKTWQWV